MTAFLPFCLLSHGSYHGWVAHESQVRSKATPQSQLTTFRIALHTSGLMMMNDRIKHKHLLS